MKLRVKICVQSGRLELPDGAVTLGDLRRRLRETYLPSLGFSLDATFSITLNGRDPLTADESSLESLGVISGDLIVVLTDEPASAAPQTSSTESKRRQCKGETAQDVAEVKPGPSPAAAEEEGASGCAPAPMLCSEATDWQVPHSLEALYLSADCSSANDALVVVTHLLMLETGYVEQGVQNKAAAMPDGWRSSGAYKLHTLCLLCNLPPMSHLLVSAATLTISDQLKCVKRLELSTKPYITFPPPGKSHALAEVSEDGRVQL
ncbi:positive regulation of autophagy of mitochondrion [Pristimantis euphronides]